MTSDPQLQLLERIGPKVLAYVLGCDMSVVLDRIADSTRRLDEPREAVIQALLSMAQPLVDQGSFEWAWPDALSRPSGPSGLAVGNYLRSTTDAPNASPRETGDDLEGALLALSFDSYPNLIAPRLSGLPNWAPTLFDHPRLTEFGELAMADADLAKLFSERDQIGPIGSMMRSTGVGGGIQLSMLASQMIGAGWKLAQLRVADPEPSHLAEATSECLRALRDGLAMRQTTISASIGVAGVLFPPHVEQVDLGWGLLRRRDARDEAFIETTNLEGTISRSDGGVEVEISMAGDLVLELKVPFSISIQKIDIDTPLPESFTSTWREIERAIENLRLGFAFAGKDSSVIKTTWRSVADPIDPLLVNSWPEEVAIRGLFPVQLSDEEIADWVAHSKTIGAKRVPEIDVAIRRALRALGERTSPDDVLVDAVIVWENLFGASTETVLRVCTCMAWLLGEDAKDRRDKQRLFKEIYNFRSKLVHGTSKVDQRKLLEHSSTARDISMAALQATFTTHSHLLEIAKSEDRSLAMLMDG